MESLSSFIGVDGTNTTLNSGRMLINLKPLASGAPRRQRDHPPPAAARSPRSSGITLYMQPVQDLTIEDRVSRTQYQYTLEDADAAELADVGAAPGRARCAALPELARRGQRPAGPGARRRPSSIDRDTASRLGITPQAIDDTLYDAFGQRQVSTIFTQLNQYRVVLEVKPEFRQDPDALKQHLRALGRPARRCRCPPSPRIEERADAARWSTTRASSRRSRISFNLAPGRRRSATAVDAIEQAAARARHAASSIETQLPGHGAAPSRPRSPTSRS